MFYGCEGMQTIPVGNWDTSNITNMRGMFENCKAVPELPVDKWDVSNVTDMGYMFKGCISLEALNIGGWDTGNVKAFNSMFSGIGHNTGEMKFTELPIEDWDTSSATDIGYMFYGCGSLTSLDLHKWDVSKVTTMRHTFADCNSITEYNFTGWNTESLQNINGIFNSNKALVTIDVSDFDTANVTDFGQTFDGCSVLQNIVGLDKWDTRKGTNFGEFLLGTQVVAIDLSSFDMSSAKTVLNMFHVNPKLTTIYVGDNWNLNPATLSSPNGMFGSSTALKGANGNTTRTLSNSAIYARVDTPETPGLLTHINDKPVAP
jgi:surface protein